MKSSDESFSTLDTDRVLLPEQMNKDLESIKDILRDNSKFFEKLVKECVKVGKKVDGKYFFLSDVDKLLADEYPELTGYSDGYQLIETSHNLAKQLCIYKNDTREQLEHTIEEIVLSGDIL